MEGPIRIGVLALQGSFREHMTLLNRIPGVEAVEVGAAASSACWLGAADQPASIAIAAGSIGELRRDVHLAVGSCSCRSRGRGQHQGRRDCCRPAAAQHNTSSTPWSSPRCVLPNVHCPAVPVLQVRTKEELQSVAGLIIPGEMAAPSLAVSGRVACCRCVSARLAVAGRWGLPGWGCSTCCLPRLVPSRRRREHHHGAGGGALGPHP